MIVSDRTVALGFARACRSRRGLWRAHPAGAMSRRFAATFTSGVVPRLLQRLVEPEIGAAAASRRRPGDDESPGEDGAERRPARTLGGSGWRYIVIGEGRAARAVHLRRRSHRDRCLSSRLSAYGKRGPYAPARDQIATVRSRPVPRPGPPRRRFRPVPTVIVRPATEPPLDARRPSGSASKSGRASSPTSTNRKFATAGPAGSSLCSRTSARAAAAPRGSAAGARRARRCVSWPSAATGPAC
jgi:hypothetical protein